MSDQTLTPEELDLLKKEYGLTNESDINASFEANVLKVFSEANIPNRHYLEVLENLSDREIYPTTKAVKETYQEIFGQDPTKMSENDAKEPSQRSYDKSLPLRLQLQNKLNNSNSYKTDARGKVFTVGDTPKGESKEPHTRNEYRVIDNRSEWDRELESKKEQTFQSLKEKLHSKLNEPIQNEE